MHTLPVKTPDFYRRATSVAEHYGFLSLADAQNLNNNVTPLTRLRDMQVISHESDAAAAPRSMLRESITRLIEGRSTNKKEPLLFHAPFKTKTEQGVVHSVALNVTATRQPIAEIMTLRVATAILDEFGIKNYMVRINSIGDRDSSARFIREVQTIIRKHLDVLSAEEREVARTNIGELIQMLHESRHELLDELPRPVEFLTAPSRKHFHDVLEFLDRSGIDYLLDERLYASRDLYSQTIFEIIPGTDDADELPIPFARGGRYDELTKSVVRTVVPSVGIVLSFFTRDKVGEVVRMRVLKPRAYLIHVGSEAQIKSFAILEALRRARVPVEQCHQHERFSEQLAYAEQKQAPFVMIVGHKEAMTNTVIVRNTATRAQVVVPMDLVPQYIKEAAV